MLLNAKVTFGCFCAFLSFKKFIGFIINNIFLQKTFIWSYQIAKIRSLNSVEKSCLNTPVYWLFVYLCPGELQHRKQQRQKKLRMEKKRENKIAASGSSSYSSGRYTSKYKIQVQLCLRANHVPFNLILLTKQIVLFNFILNCEVKAIYPKLTKCMCSTHLPLVFRHKWRFLFSADKPLYILVFPYYMENCSWDSMEFS